MDTGGRLNSQVVAQSIHALKAELAPELLEATEKPAKGWVRWKVRQLKTRITNYLQTSEFFNGRNIRKKHIKDYRFTRSLMAAGLLKSDFHVNAQASARIEAKLEEARAHWNKNPIEFAQWCFEENRPYPEQFIDMELLPWLADSLSELKGISDQKAVQLVDAIKEDLSLSDFTGDPPPTVPKNPSDAERLERLRNESPEDYLQSFKEAGPSPREQIRQLSQYLKALKTASNARKLPPKDFISQIKAGRMKAELDQWMK